jgi:hypothetical protein
MVLLGRSLQRQDLSTAPTTRKGPL